MIRLSNPEDSHIAPVSIGPGSDRLCERVGVVVIGRNEGARLAACLDSLPKNQPVVYVDSGSTDDSVATAKRASVDIVRLDPEKPFTAARGRNEGLAHLLENYPRLDLVQFVDGDCELTDHWLQLAAAELDRHPNWAIVCGHCRERRPRCNIYHRLAAIEWNTPIGETDACGGNALMRITAVRAAGGFRCDLPAGEEPELCLRIRRKGFQVRRLDAEMVIHDLAMTGFGEWWARCERAGRAVAMGAWLHGTGPERFRIRELTRIIFWALALPVTALGLASWTQCASLALGLLYAYPLIRAARWARRRAATRSDALLYGLACLVGRFAQMAGLTRFAWRQLTVRTDLGPAT